jgi:hypothetical protein
MGAYIAVNDPLTIVNLTDHDASVDLSPLKSEALMFSTICIPTLKDSFFRSNHLYNNARHVLDELEWMLENGVLHQVPNRLEGDDPMADDAENFVSALIRSKLDRDTEQLEILRNIERPVRALGEISARYHVNRMRQEGSSEVYPVVAFGLTSKESEPKSDVIDVVINSFPIPHQDTSWEQIHEFRLDPDSHRKFHALKVWVNDLAHMKLAPNEVKDKLDSLLAEYEAHMKTHRIKTRLDTLKTVVLSEFGITTAGWFTGHARLAGVLGMIAAPLFSLTMRQLGLSEEERKAPGKELAYVFKAKETFKKTTE